MLTGTRISPPVSIDAIGTVLSSTITWTQTTPAGTSILVEVGISDSNLIEPTYATATSGSAIPGLSGDVTGKWLWCKQTLSTDDASVTPELSNIAIEINGQIEIGLQTDTLEYYFDATQTLRFLTEPRVTLQAPQATHVTVYVRDNRATTEYTAIVDPAPPTEKRVERLVVLDSGDLATCTAVANQLLALWSRELRSVEGEIPLTVTLRFREKVRVIVPEAGIDEDMPIRKKVHMINNSGTQTSVVLGDIILSEYEIIARELEKLGGV
jgi:hypothetical protein